MTTASAYDIIETSFGWVGLLASDGGLRRTTLPQESPDECIAQLGKEVEKAGCSPERFKGLSNKLVLYFRGEPVSFDDEPIDVADASPFFRAAWRACRSIPRGETRPYGWLAESAGRPRASRAAGQAMARNRLAIVVPCHRVVGSDGALTGFGKGSKQLALKRRLLDLEAEKR